jgi:NADH:ubiquinone reductase (H+-translocating)
LLAPFKKRPRSFSFGDRPTGHSIICGSNHNRKARSSHHIVVVGGGIAGLAIASKLPRTGRTPIAVTLTDREPAYVYKPMLHAIAAGTSDFSQQETDYIAQA